MSGHTVANDAMACSIAFFCADEPSALIFPPVPQSTAGAAAAEGLPAGGAAEVPPAALLSDPQAASVSDETSTTPATLASRANCRTFTGIPLLVLHRQMPPQPGGRGAWLTISRTDDLEARAR